MDILKGDLQGKIRTNAKVRVMRYKRILMFSLILKDVQLNLIKNVIDIYSKINYDEGNSELLKVVDTYLFKPLIELDKYNNVNSKLLHHKLKVIKRYSKDLIEYTLYEHSCENCGEYFLEDDNEYFNQYRCCDRVCYGELVGVSIY